MDLCFIFRILFNHPSSYKKGTVSHTYQRVELTELNTDQRSQDPNLDMFYNCH